LSHTPRREDVLSVFAGIRPLVRAGGAGNTAALSRDHTIRIEETGLVTVCGGKWTTYRRMAEDCVNQAATLARLPEKPCVTYDLRIHGYCEDATSLGYLRVYGSDAARITALERRERLHPALPYTAGEVIWAVREEMARSVEDVLARRTRALFLNARAALELSSPAADLMARELQRDEEWKARQLAQFHDLAQNYLVSRKTETPAT
jgi:glycerol-3-phosphate dehydrogenase